MDLKGEQVVHKTFGSGTVESLEKGRIIIKFAAKTGTKVFVYPGAFEKYLVMSEPEVQALVNKDLDILLKQLEDERTEQEAKYNEEQERLRLERMPKKKPARKPAVRKTAVKKAVEVEVSEENKNDKDE